MHSPSPSLRRTGNYSKCGAKSNFSLHYFFANLTVLISWIATTASGLAMTVMGRHAMVGELYRYAWELWET